MRQAEIYRKGLLAGILTEDGGEYRFCYDEGYLKGEDAQPVSLTLPLQTEAYVSPVLFPFFDGLIPEGWLLDSRGHGVASARGCRWKRIAARRCIKIYFVTVS